MSNLIRSCSKKGWVQSDFASVLEYLDSDHDMLATVPAGTEAKRTAPAEQEDQFAGMYRRAGTEFKQLVRDALVQAAS